MTGAGRFLWTRAGVHIASSDRVYTGDGRRAAAGQKQEDDGHKGRERNTRCDEGGGLLIN